MAKAKKPEVSSLQKALEYVALIYKASDQQSSYCLLEMGRAISFNMIVGLGYPIQEDLCACPQMDLLLAALERCGPEFAITQLSPVKLLIRSGEFHAYIPCLNPSALTCCLPDAMAGPLNDDFIEAVAKVAPFASTTKETVLECAIQLYDGSVLSTNRSVVIEAWHGHSMPSGMLLPKTSVGILRKIMPRKSKRHLIGFGFSTTSITFYFDDNCWMKSQLYQDKLPDIRPHIEKASQAHMHEIPHDFFAAVERVAPFSTDGRIYVEGSTVSSHPLDAKEEGSGLSLEFDGSGHAYRVYGASDLSLIADTAKRWDEHARADGTLFFGDKVRGMIWHSETAGVNHDHIDAEDDDIPF